MNKTAEGSVTMRQDAPAMAHSSGYSTEGWTTMSPYSQSPYDGSHMSEYSGFGAYVTHGLTAENLQRMPPLAQHQRQHHQHNPMMPHSTAIGGHQLPLLSTAWPSQLTNPTPSSGGFSATVVTVPSVHRITPAIDTPKLPSQAEKGRKTLTTEQKRAMCQFHEENPGTRQADIGLRFGVERSTVSKVLRHKEQYLRRDQEPDPAALKRVGKAKHPDFDRTLSNYVRRQQHQGFDIKDEEIMEQARLFARASGNQDAILGSLTNSWLQKFKQKHGVGTARLARRASETNISDETRFSGTHSTSNGPNSNELSPNSPNQPLSPLSGSRSDDEAHREQNMEFDFNYRPPNSQSTTSLASDVRDNAEPSFAGGATLSPTASFNFSPDPNVGGFQPLTMRHALPPDFEAREKRSHTFPSIDVSYGHRQGSSTEPVTPQFPPPGAASLSALDSPANDMQTAPFHLNTDLTSPLSLHRSASNSSMTARASVTPVESSPASPTSEDARRAANTLLHYLQNSGPLFQSSDYNAIVQLTKKLELHQHQSHRPPAGGLSRIPEGDAEMNVPTGPAMMQAR